MLEKSRTVLVRPTNYAFGGMSALEILFITERDENESMTEYNARRHVYYMPRSTWEEMGEPGTITLTVEPGDKLNG